MCWFENLGFYPGAALPECSQSKFKSQRAENCQEMPAAHSDSPVGIWILDLPLLQRVSWEQKLGVRLITWQPRETFLVPPGLANLSPQEFK